MKFSRMLPLYDFVKDLDGRRSAGTMNLAIFQDLLVRVKFIDWAYVAIHNNEFME